MPELKTDSTGQALPDHNYVGENQIWKDHVDHEYRSARNWNKHWTFMKTDYKDLVKEEYPDGSRKEIPIPEHLQIAPAPPLEECVTVHATGRPVPKTTSGQVGWRSGDQRLNLERYGQYSRPRGGLLKQLNWPKEAVG